MASNRNGLVRGAAVLAALFSLNNLAIADGEFPGESRPRTQESFGSAPSDDHYYAGDERSAAAMGHYSRAKTMLVEALAEFERGRAIARPDLLIDPEGWRSGVITKAEELNRLLDPQPKVSKGGARFEGNPSLLKDVTRHQKVPSLDDFRTAAPEARKPAAPTRARLSSRSDSYVKTEADSERDLSSDFADDSVLDEPIREKAPAKKLSKPSRETKKVAEPAPAKKVTAPAPSEEIASEPMSSDEFLAGDEIEDPKLERKSDTAANDKEEKSEPKKPSVPTTSSSDEDDVAVAKGAEDAELKARLNKLVEEISQQEGGADSKEKAKAE